jgi:hypothetical protein
VRYCLVSYATKQTCCYRLCSRWLRSRRALRPRSDQLWLAWPSAPFNLFRARVLPEPAQPRHPCRATTGGIPVPEDVRLVELLFDVTARQGFPPVPLLLSFGKGAGQTPRNRQRYTSESQNSRENSTQTAGGDSSGIRNGVNGNSTVSGMLAQRKLGSLAIKCLHDSRSSAVKIELTRSPHHPLISSPRHSAGQPRPNQSRSRNSQRTQDVDSGTSSNRRAPTHRCPEWACCRCR